MDVVIFLVGSENEMKGAGFGEEEWGKRVLSRVLLPPLRKKALSKAMEGLFIKVEGRERRKGWKGSRRIECGESSRVGRDPAEAALSN